MTLEAAQDPCSSAIGTAEELHRSPTGAPQERYTSSRWELYRMEALYGNPIQELYSGERDHLFASLKLAKQVAIGYIQVDLSYKLRLIEFK